MTPRTRQHVRPLQVGASALLLATSAVPALAQPAEDGGEDIWMILQVVALPLFLIAVTSLVAGVAFALVISGTKADLVQREVEILDNHRTAAFFWGLLTGGVLFALMAAGFNSGDDKGGGYVFAGLLLAVIGVGGTGLSAKVGRQIMASRGKPEAPLGTAAALGGTCLILRSLIPFVGWGYALYDVVLSVGAFRLAAVSPAGSVRRLRAWFRGGREAVQSETQAEGPRIEGLEQE